MVGRALENQSQALTLVASMRLLHHHAHQSSISVSTSMANNHLFPQREVRNVASSSTKGFLLSACPICGRDKGMLNGWSFNWESMATRERGNAWRRVV